MFDSVAFIIFPRNLLAGVYQVVDPVQVGQLLDLFLQEAQMRTRVTNTLVQRDHVGDAVDVGQGQSPRSRLLWFCLQSFAAPLKA